MAFCFWLYFVWGVLVCVCVGGFLNVFCWWVLLVGFLGWCYLVCFPGCYVGWLFLVGFSWLAVLGLFFLVYFLGWFFLVGFWFLVLLVMLVSYFGGLVGWDILGGRLWWVTLMSDSVG